MLKLIIGYVFSYGSFILFMQTLLSVQFVIGLIYYNHSVTAKLKDLFKQLPVYSKITVILFSIFFAIPNKIFINNSQNKLLTAFLILLITILSNVFASFILLYISFWVNVLGSFIFAISYEDEEDVSFKEGINKELFNEDENFAEEYFHFFWGEDMYSGGAGKILSGAVGILLSSIFNIARNQEKDHVQFLALILELRSGDKQKPRTLEESMAIQKEIADHVIERDTVILKAEKRIRELVLDALDWFNNF